MKIVFKKNENLTVEGAFAAMWIKGFLADPIYQKVFYSKRRVK